MAENEMATIPRSARRRVIAGTVAVQVVPVGSVGQRLLSVSESDAEGMGKGMGSSGFVRFLTGITAVLLTGAAVGGVVLTLRGSVAPSPTVEFAVSRMSGTVLLEAVSDAGEGRFTEPVAVDLGLDPLLLPLPPLNAGTIESPHHRGSPADALAAGAFGRGLVEVSRAGTRLTISVVEGVADDTMAGAGVLSDLEDTDHDGLDDDGRFTLSALDGSAVCARIPVERSLVAASGFQDAGGVPVSGYWWSPYGSCGSPESVPMGSDVRMGTTPGVYGAARSGEVCDVGALATMLDGDEVSRTAFATSLGIDESELVGFLDGLTPVILLADTVVTDHVLQGGRILARSAILQRGTAVLVDTTGAPRVRCMSGSPLRTSPPIPAGVTIEGTPWVGFSLESAQTIPASARKTSEFVLVDVHSGFAMHRAPGITGALTRLAGPLVPPAAG
jgi:hypothetical protein